MSNTTKSKRVKEVFKSSEIGHIFAHQGAPKGRCDSSMSFGGSTFFSYWTPIARLLSAPSGKQVVIYNAANYGPTTGRHLSHVRSATSHIHDRFSVEGEGRGCRIPENGEELVAHYLERYESECRRDAENPSRYQRINARNTLCRFHVLTEAERAAEVFGRKESLRAIQGILKGTKAAIEAANQIIASYEVKRVAAREKREAKEEAQRKINKATEIESAIERAELFIAGKEDPKIGRDADFFGHSGDWMLDSRPDLLAAVNKRRLKLAENAAESWRAGDSSYIVCRAVDRLTLLRREGEEIATSKGARIPIEHARKAFAFVKLCHDRAEPFRCNGRSIHVGHYTIDAIDQDGTVRAGCHVIPYPEITRLAITENWIASPTENEVAFALEGEPLNPYAQETH